MGSCVLTRFKTRRDVRVSDAAVFIGLPRTESLVMGLRAAFLGLLTHISSDSSLIRDSRFLAFLFLCFYSVSIKQMLAFLIWIFLFGMFLILSLSLSIIGIKSPTIRTN